MRNGEAHDEDTALGVDIFQMGQTESPANSNAEQQAAKKATTTSEKRTAKLGHVAAAAAIATVAWIGWPFFFSPTPDDRLLSPNILTPDQAMSEATRQSQVTESALVKVTAPALERDETRMPPQAADAAIHATSEPPLEKAPAATQNPSQNLKDAALQAQIEDLQNRLALTEATATSLSVQMDELKRQVTRSRSSGAANKKAATRQTVSEAEPKRAPGFSLNTVYRDQAWIQNGEQTYIVQAGDVIEGVEIRRIDATARKVITSLGDIR